MGSTGSGSFTDYSGSQKPKGGGGGGGSSATDRCKAAFSCTLQDVAQSAYFSAHGIPPPVQTQLNLVLRTRVFAIDSNGTVVGALPTSYNYLAACLNAGFNYIGIVTASSGGTVPLVSADFIAT